MQKIKIDGKYTYQGVKNWSLNYQADGISYRFFVEREPSSEDDASSIFVTCFSINDPLIFAPFIIKLFEQDFKKGMDLIIKNYEENNNCRVNLIDKREENERKREIESINFSVLD